jgi:hypothetical protein
VAIFGSFVEELDGPPLKPRLQTTREIDKASVATAFRDFEEQPRAPFRFGKWK